MEKENELGQQLRAMRRRKGLSSKVVAQAVGTTQSHLCALERGSTSSPRYKLLKALAKYYDLTLSELVGDAREKPVSTEAKKIADWYENDLSEKARRIAYVMMKTLRRQCKEER